MHWNATLFSQVIKTRHHKCSKQYCELTNCPIFKKNEPWDLICYSDSAYAGDSGTRHSAPGLILNVCDVPTFWTLKA
ncbi:hypothetical protein ACHAXS_000650 [Conticribra weissflogii]